MVERTPKNAVSIIVSSARFHEMNRRYCCSLKVMFLSASEGGNRAKTSLRAEIISAYTLRGRRQLGG